MAGVRRGSDDAAELLDLKRAAALAGRHPETLRRWVWSGRLAARRSGNRLLVERADVEALAAASGRPVVSLAAWASRAQAALAASGRAGAGRSAADLVVDDRERRSRPARARAGR